MPLSLLLNGITALFAVFGFARSGLVDWRKAFTLSLVTTVVAPTGAYLVQFVPQLYVWLIYLASVLYLSYRLFRPVWNGRARKTSDSPSSLPCPSPFLRDFSVSGRVFS